MSEADPRLYPTRPILAASVAVFRDGRVLLAERVNPPAANCFSLPGGLVEAGESLEAAALRELVEETGVRARILGFNDHVEVIERDDRDRIARHFVVASFVGEWIDGDGTVGPEARRILWADPRAIDDLPTTPGLLRVLHGAGRFFT
ncbi:NUDIX hydrolase [Lichenifustis flavocetrariae]|uniref:NUDIX hydrolase n=1 Tax=Lichenifustis flavocetrariae TaxID=2949735 RepID=A0AA41YX07_9HYPH|nr:NUDIX hydrolase [Lichenifustis flavocetrariae]MCW6510131.1 NUDIX hydrolase [Lichenifustis flavocetrariae]